MLSKESQIKIEKMLKKEVKVPEDQPALFSQQYIKNKDGTATPRSLEFMK